MPYAPAETTRLRPPRPRFVPWTVPAWLPREVEGPATFLVGVLGGLLIAFCFATLTDLLISIGSSRAPAPEPTSRLAAVVEPGARVLIIARASTYAERATLDIGDLEPRPITRHAASRKIATVRAVPKRDVLFAAALGP